MSELGAEQVIPVSTEVVKPISTTSGVISTPAQSVEQAKSGLIDPRAISKKHDPEGRSVLAANIVGARKEGRSVRSNIAEQDQIRQQTSDQYFALGPAEKQTATDLAQRNKSKLVKLKAKLGIGDKKASDLQEQLAAIKIERTTLSDQSGQAAHELQALEKHQVDIPDPKELLKAYYEKMETQPLTNQEKRELLVPEVLSSLSTEEYIALWKRLNPDFLSHVTRQGFRDHTGHLYHTGGLQEFQDSFIGVMTDDRLLRPPLVLRGLKSRDESTVKKFLEDWVLQAESPDEARIRLDILLNSSLASAPSYPDKTAVHFAAQVVANDFYGGENNNEIFFVFPSDAVASQYNFAFNGGADFTMGAEGKWNDVFVWPNTVNNPGIPVDAGFVFLPENTPVDPKTGSKYVSEIRVVDGKEQRVMIEDTNLVTAFVDWAKSLNEQSPVIKAYKTYYVGRSDESLRQYLIVLTEELQRRGVSNDTISALIRDNRLDLLGLSSVSKGQEVVDETWQGILRESNGHWKRPENAIPAKQYWENYFAQNPDFRPRHGVYYDGDPTTAIYEFQQKNNIGRVDTTSTDGKLLGFDDHLVKLISKGDKIEDQDPRGMVGYKELLATGNKIISDHYAIKMVT